MKIKKIALIASALACVAPFASGCDNPFEKKDPEVDEKDDKEQVTLVSISASMSKTTYVEGDLLSLAGLKVVAHYSDNTEKEITGYSVNHEEGDAVAMGDKVIITLGDKTCEIALTVTEKGVVLESLTAVISKTSYFEGEKLGSITLTGHYSNGTDAEIKGGYEISMNGTNIGATHTMVMSDTELTVSYEGKTSNTIAIEVKKDVVVSISVSNKFREFAPNAEFVKETVTATYASGKTADVTSQAEFTGYDMSVEDTYTVSVSLGAIVTSYEIVVSIEFDTRVMVSISAEVTEVERHDQVSVKTSLRNAETSDVSYSVVSGPATISSEGVVTVSDDAEVGAEIKVSATAKEVTSNVLTFTVKDTLPTGVSIAVDSVFLKDGSSVTLTPTFSPSWATLTDVKYTADKDYVSIIDGEVSLREGVSEFDHVTEKVTITATCFDNETATSTKELTVGYDNLVISVDSGSVVVGRDSLDNLSVGVSAITVVDQIPQTVGIETSKYTFESSDEKVITVGEHTGKITVVGHGSATITAKVGSKSGSSTFTVVVPPEEIVVNGYNNTILAKGLKTGVGEANKIKAPFISTRTDSMAFSKALDYSFELHDSEDKLVEKASNEIASVDEEGFITFNVEGKVVAKAKSNSAIGKVEAGKYEQEKTATFIVNNLKNIYKQEELHFALYNPEVKGINLMNDIMFKKMVDVEVKGESNTYSSYWTRNGNEEYFGFTSRGDKTIQGNGYKLSLEELELAKITNTEAVDKGDDLLVFAAKEFDNGDASVDDVIGTPYHVEVHDFSIIGNSDYQGDYVGKISYPAGTDVAIGNFTQSFRRGMRLGVQNAKAGFSTFDSKTAQPRRDFQKCANAYVKAPLLENVTIQGFETGLRSEHVVDGIYRGLDIKDSYINASEVNQCIVEYNNTKIRQVGGFAIEVVPDGMDMTNIFKGGQLGIDFEEAGEGYDELPEVKMTGKIDAINMNDGTSTEHMQTRSLKNYTIKDIIFTVVEDMINEVGSELIAKDAQTYGFLATATEAVANHVAGSLAGVLYNARQEIDFFCLMFLYEYNAFLKTYSTVIMGSDICNFHCEKDSTGGTADSISLHDLVENIIVTYVTKGEAVKYEGYKSYQYITLDLDGVTIQSLAANLGSVVVVNQGYDANYIPE